MSCSSATSSRPGRIQTSDGTAIDLRNIRSPIVVFCSKGDNITPPQQALGWILDLYENVDEIRSYGQTIVYTIHETVGHLGIFVSGGVAKKEHGEFSSNIDLIDTLAARPLRGGVRAQDRRTPPAPDLVTGDWVMRCEARTLDDIRALGGNDAADERRFATAARVSEINLALYRTFAQPVVRALVSSALAEWMQQMHPLRLQYEMFSDANPMMAPVAAHGGQVRKNRKPVAADNPFVAMQEERVAADRRRARCMARLQRDSGRADVPGGVRLAGAAGRGRHRSMPTRGRCARPPRIRCISELLQKRIAELKSRIPIGGLREAVIRGLLYVGMAPRPRSTSAGLRLCAAFAQRMATCRLPEFKALRARAVHHAADR